MKIRSTTLLLSLVVLIFSTNVANSHSLEFKRIYFPDGRPYSYESSKQLHIILGKNELVKLEQILAALKDRPDIGAKVLGFADKHECRPSECLDLSLRRARSVFDWLFDHGLPRLQLKGPEGLSTAWPLYGGATDEEKSFNRRVDFEPYIIPKAVPDPD